MRQNQICLNAVKPKIPDSLSEDRLMFSSAGAQPISLKLLKAEVKNLQQQIHEHEQQAENIGQFVQRVKRNPDARQQESQATDTGQILRRRKRTRLDKDEDGAVWYREYERLPSQNDNRRICVKTRFA